MKTIKAKINKKVNQIKWRVKSNTQKLVNWTIANKEFVIFAAPIVIGFIKWSGKTTAKAFNNKKAENVKNLYVYDPSAGLYYSLRRPLSNDEKRYIDRKVHDARHPRRMGEVLNDMGVLR